LKITSAILQHELIGLQAKVVQSSNPSCLGICGRVVDETQKTFTILHQRKEKVIVKQTSVLHFTLVDGSLVEIHGTALVGRPEDRAKKVVRRRW
jgi:ribonuclease P protein subunit POP4